jgi:hypothetical protein
VKPGRLLAGLLLLGACAEVRQAPPPPPPADLAAGTADPARAAMGAAAAAFADRGAGLADRPAEAAQALAQLEFLTAELSRNPRFAPLPESLRREFLLARTESRDALGIDEQAPPDAVVTALLATARALRAGDRAAAAQAMPAPTFRPGGARSIVRLGELGPLPQTALATGLGAEAFTRLDTQAGWVGREVVGGVTGGATYEPAAGGLTAGY